MYIFEKSSTDAMNVHEVEFSLSILSKSIYHTVVFNTTTLVTNYFKQSKCNKVQLSIESNKLKQH